MKNTTDINGWFDYENVYDFLLSKIPDGGVIVECGAWLGKSSSYLCDRANNRIIIYIVDTWLGSLNELNTHHILATQTDIYNIFLSNMGDRKFIPLKMNSIQAASQFKNNSLDVVFIDMEHSYEAVKNDISHWLPKIKSGGYIAGHDYNDTWPGVILAVNELLDYKNIIIINNCWIYHKL